MVPKRQKLALLGAMGGMVTLGAAALAGGALAQTPPSGSGSGSGAAATPNAGQQQHQAQEEQFLNDLAKNLGVDRSKLDTALKTTETQEVDAAVQSGRLTQTQATQIKQAIANGTGPIGFGGFFGGPGGPGGRGGLGGLPANVRQAMQDAVSKALGGESQDQLRTELQAGKTPDQIAQAHGTTVAAVNTAVAAAAKPLLDQAVTAGTMTATQEQQILDGLKASQGFGFRGGPGPGTPPGPGNGTGAPVAPSATPRTTT